MLPLANALERSATAKTQRLKLNGHTKVSVRLTPMPGASEGARPPFARVACTTSCLSEGPGALSRVLPM